MRGRGWYSSLLLSVLLVGIAFAQQDSLKRDTTKDGTPPQSENAASSNGSAKVQEAKGDRLAFNGNNQPTDQPKTTPGKGSAPAPQDPTPHFVEDFPPNQPDVPHSHIPLPVILDSTSPTLDRSVRREEIQALPEDYVIGEEDMLTVTIWKEHDLSGSVVVRPDGRITVPLVGEVKVVGMTPIQLKNLLEEKLKPFITVPQVSVAVNQINSRKVYLIGQVVREGTFPINSSMTVLQVLAGAGGLRDFAKKKKIYVLRKRGDQEIRFPFDYDAAIKGRNREENIRVEPGDTIVVP